MSKVRKKQWIRNFLRQLGCKDKGNVDLRKSKNTPVEESSLILALKQNHFYK